MTQPASRSHADLFLQRDADMATWLGGWLAGCLSVTRRYWIKTAKPTLKLFPPSGSPIILVSSDLCADTKFQGEPLQQGVKYIGVGKIGDFRAIFD